MAILVHRYDAPDRFVAGTVGQPGERTFFLQAREGNRITSVACEKQQVSVLAEHLDKVLDEVVRRSAGEINVPPASTKARDVDPLDAPITEEFRVGTMTIAWDPTIDRIVIELFSNVDNDAEEAEAEPARRGGPQRGGRHDQRGRGVRGEDHRVLRAGLRRSGPGPGRRRSAAVPVLPAAARPERAHLPAGQRLPSRALPLNLANHPALSAALTEGELTVTGRLLQASNATFLAELTGACGPIECVYKPVEGERPLWDFPQRTLGYREVAAYEVSRIGGFDCVPVTVFVDGPLGRARSRRGWTSTRRRPGSWSTSCPARTSRRRAGSPACRASTPRTGRSR